MKNLKVFCSRMIMTLNLILCCALFLPGGISKVLAQGDPSDVLKQLEKVQREDVEKHSLANKLDISFYGFVDVSYTHNFNNPGNQVNQLRAFDTDAQSFRVNLAQLVLEREGKHDGSMTDRAGFHVKLNFGEDSQFTGGDDFGDEFDFQEVYVQYIAPLGKGVDLKFGRQNTLIGYEVIESPLNPNFSRSFMFSFGEPFTTTGIRASYAFNEYVAFAIGGIDSFTQGPGDFNRGKSVETALFINPNDKVGLTGFLFWGPELPGVAPATVGPKGDLILAGGIATFQATDQTSFALEGYYANQEAVGPGGGTARWNGVAAYALHEFTDQWGVHIRGEIFEDAGGSRTCLVTAPTGPGASAVGKSNTCVAVAGAGVAQTLWESTVTLQFKPVPPLITRLEFRYDKSDKNTFQSGASAVNHQETLAFETIFLF
ncbi:outer membrane beta-barrel protein [Candidatus Nitronereus thalassa]|uniref:Outer membrane beta-barrel protein n=1 Tax=Candidatus Nitronereus thalassa TaxID=3020898 RepID=A0ABU3K487_9BACT|nr:outer membrane beta-barrel protein [Candidatus Nitronereus thalassa]MDT7041184.1 outer membrane beta-barrel protein [Candidatus Nitronereus thalassa]